MIQNVLSHIGGVGVYGVISICLFFASFVAVGLWTLSLKKSYRQNMSQLPLEDDDPDPVSRVQSGADPRITD